MARLKKKGTTGNAKNYITRSQAVRKLQISLPDFRRLCIFKGVYPREPRSKKKASKSATPSTTFYYARDIQYLLHEPLLAKFRDQKTLAKKISRALGRNDVGHASRLEKTQTPRLQLDHVIKERYPTFVDALRDLDDALSMVFLFANLPSTESVPAKVVAKCKRLSLEFEQYLIRTHTLRKSFLSIKGIYYQATLEGQDVLWLVPHRFVQNMSGDIDFRIMATFVEFYTTLLGFVNFRLYTKIGLVYPPRFDTDSEDQGAELGAISIQAPNTEAFSNNSFDLTSTRSAQRKADRLFVQEQELDSADNSVTTPELSNALDTFSPIDSTADTLLQPQPTADALVAGQLFKDLVVFISRETPRHSLEFLLRAFGCKRIAWDPSVCEKGAFCAESDARITHQIVDRPEVTLSQDSADGHGAEAAARRIPGRIYIQPQWVWDSINAGKLQRPDLYGPGALLPPHLSPWIKPKKGEYDPTVSLEDQETEVERGLAHDMDEYDDPGNDHDRALRADTVDIDTTQPEADFGASMQVQLGESDSSADESEALPDHAGDQWDGLSGDDVSDDDHEVPTTAMLKQHQVELEAELHGRPADRKHSRDRAAASRETIAHHTREDRLAREDIERRKMMMSRRKRKMYEKMVYSNARKDEESERLRGKRRKLEKQAKGRGVL